MMRTARRATWRHSLAALLVSVAACAVLVPRAAGDVGLTPMRADVVAAPGGAAVPVELTVINTSDGPRTVRFTVEDFTVGDHGELLFLHDIEQRGLSAAALERHAGAQHVTLLEGHVELDPFEERVVTAVVSLPQGARGQYYAMARADAGATTPRAVRGAAHNLRVRLQVGAFLFITAGWQRPGSREGGAATSTRRVTPARYDVQVTGLHAEFPGPGDERQALRVVAEVDNRSTVHYIGDVTAVILDVENRRIVERIRFSQGVRLVLPNSRRVYVGEVRSRLEPGTYRIRFDVDGDGPRLRASHTTHLELMEAVVGVGGAGRSVGVLDVAPDGRITLGGGRYEQRVRVYNNTDDPLRVAAQLDGAGDPPPGLRVSPKRFSIPPGGVRSVRVLARAQDRAKAATAELVLMPSTRGGVAFPLDEARRLEVHVDAGSRRRRRRAPQ